MFRFVKVFSVAALSLGVVSGAEAASYSFSTADSLFDPTSFNQGWWNSNDVTNLNAINTPNVYTGTYFSGPDHRSFFTFDLSGLNLAANEQITSVTFAGNSSNVIASNGGAETIGFYDVSTSAAMLNEHLGATAGVYADLGSGNIYGFNNFFQSDAYTDFEIGLNDFAYADILAAQGGYFSIGAALLSFNNSNQEFVFGGSGGTPFSLNIETQISAVPLPAALPLYGAGLAMMGFIGWRKRQKKAAA